MNTMKLEKERAFYTIMLGQLVSTVGSSMTRFGLGIWVLNETGDTAAYTLLLFCAVLPLGIGSIFSGPLVDRWNRRYTLIIANILASLSTLVIMLLYFADILAFWHLLVAVTINGLANSFVLPALEASVPLLVSKDQLGRAAGLTQMIQALEMILGPALAGLLISFAGLGAIFISDFITFGAALLALTLVLIPQPSDADKMGSDGSLWDSFVFGVKYIWERPSFIHLIGLVTLTMFLIPGFGYALMTPLVLSFADERSAGFVMSAFGFGSLVAGILMAAWGGPKRYMDGMLVALFATGLSMGFVGLRPSFPLIMAGVFFLGLSFVFMIGLSRVIWQVKVAPKILGRVFALRVALGVVAQSIGIFLSGWLATNVFEPRLAENGAWAPLFGSLIGVGDGRGIGLMYIILGGCTIIVAIVCALIPTIRHLEDNVPDYVDPEAVLMQSDKLAAAD